MTLAILKRFKLQLGAGTLASFYPVYLMVQFHCHKIYICRSFLLRWRQKVLTSHKVGNPQTTFELVTSFYATNKLPLFHTYPIT